MKLRSRFGRRGLDLLVKTVACLAALTGCGLLGWILFDVYQKGAPALTWEFLTTEPAGLPRAGADDFDFTKIPEDAPLQPSAAAPKSQPTGGVGNAIIGTVAITALATLLSVPLGLLAGFYLAEFGRNSWLAAGVRFAANTAFGVPSIIVGMFVYVILVVPMESPSGYAGGLALAIIMLPVIARTTEDMLRLVPDNLREATLGLGASRWQTTLLVSRAARAGILTGVLLAVARVSGETAPLIFTASHSPYWLNFSSLEAFNQSFRQATPNLTNTIYQYTANNPSETLVSQGWAGALVITVGVLFVNILTRVLFRGRTYDAG